MDYKVKARKNISLGIFKRNDMQVKLAVNL